MISSQAKIIKKIVTVSNRDGHHDIDHVREKRKKHQKSIEAVILLSKKPKFELSEINGVKVLWVDPLVETVRTIIYLHGGGFVYGLSPLHLAYAEKIATLCRARVLLIDYSLSPESKYPVALNEIMRVWASLIKGGLDPVRAAIMGDSAGASLAIATTLKLRDDKLPTPACLVLFSPSVDATLSCKSYITNNDSDVVLSLSLMKFFIESYVGDGDKTDPFVSPLLADLHDLPPLLLQVGSDEVLLDECKQFAQHAERDGVKTKLIIGDGMWHNWHLLMSRTLESRQSLKTVAGYIADNC